MSSGGTRGPTAALPTTSPRPRPPSWQHQAEAVPKPPAPGLTNFAASWMRRGPRSDRPPTRWTPTKWTPNR